MASSPRPSSTLLRLALEEVRALPRGRFTLPGAAVALALLTLLGAGPAVRVGGTFWIFWFTLYVVAPCVLAAVVAARVAGARASRFVHGVFTAPVTKAQHLTAGVLASLTLGAAYLAATLPFAAVAVYHLSDASIVLGFLAVGVGMVAFATALGTLLGVLITGRGEGAAAGLAAGVAVVAALAMVYITVIVAGPDGAANNPLAVRAVHLSPVVLLMGAADVFAHPFRPASPGRAAAAFGVLTVGLFATAAWVYLREQGVEAWESPPRRRALVALVALAIILSPAAVAGTAYDTGGKTHIGLITRSHESGVHMALATPGLSLNATRSADEFGHGGHFVVGETVQRELVLSRPFGHGEWSNATDVRVTVEAHPALNLEGHTDLRFDAFPTEPVAGGEAGEGPEEEPVLRVPLKLTPAPLDNLGWNVYDIRVTLTYNITVRNGAPPQYADWEGPARATAQAQVIANVASASTLMTLAGAPSLLACTAGAALRWRRTR